MLHNASICLQGKQGSWGDGVEMPALRGLNAFVGMLSRSAVSVLHKAANLLLIAQIVLKQRSLFAMP